MKLFHLSDLHIGKQLHGYSLMEDQVFILKEVIGKIKERRPELVLIAGDVYDKSLPSAEAVAVFDDFLTALAEIPNGPQVLICGGNHDSGERLSFGSRLFADRNLHIVGNAPDREHPQIRQMTFSDEYGDVTVYILPYLRPSYVREIPGLEDVKTYEDALRGLLKYAGVKTEERNVLLCHQFFTWGGRMPERSDSEMIHVGGQGNIDAAAVEMFDYVAAGHIHRPQNVGTSNVRYCGSPLKYSVSEADYEKSITEVTLGKKGEISAVTLPLSPLHDVRKMKGTLAELLSEEVQKEADPDDYVSVTLTDEEELYEPGTALSRVYKNLLEWKVENARTRYEMKEPEFCEEKKSLMELFCDFYAQMQGEELSGRQMKVMEKIAEAAEGGER